MNARLWLSTIKGPGGSDVKGNIAITLPLEDMEIILTALRNYETALYLVNSIQDYETCGKLRRYLENLEWD